MAIPDAILRKPGALTEAETEIMREHCFRGYQILKRIPFLSEAAEIVYAHQERFDGTGYPRGLKGEDIPIGARIFAVADTLDAITSARPYRAGNSISVARQEIERFSGAQFDPKIARVFLDMPAQVFEEIRSAINIVRDSMGRRAKSVRA
jgi:HD-GYP domain-containing protein (c-di-GMP phosphodiesterase class II)